MEIADDQIGSLVRLVSEERLNKLIVLTGSQREALALHQQTLEVGSMLLKLVATIEIAMRNSVVENLSQHFGVTNWLQQPPVAFQWRDIERTKIASAVDSAKRAVYAKMTQTEKANLDLLAYPQGRPSNLSHLRRAKDRRKCIAVTEGQVVAEFTLYFWKRLFGPEYEQTLWRPTLKRTFPDKKLKRAEVATELEVIYQARNRLAHHEPVLHRRFAQTIEAIKFVTQRLGTTAPEPNSPLAALLQDDIERAAKAEAELSSILDSFRK